MVEYCVASYIFREVIDLRTHFGHYFRVLHTVTDQTMTNALAAMDLTAAQGHILGYLAHRSSPACARDIEEAFQLSHPTVSGLLQRMEKKGFLSLRPDETDRRCKRIFIQEKGYQVLDTMHRTILGIETQLIQGFTPEDQAQFTDLLQRAIRNMGESPCKRKPKEEPTDND